MNAISRYVSCGAQEYCYVHGSDFYGYSYGSNVMTIIWMLVH